MGSKAKYTFLLYLRSVLINQVTTQDQPNRHKNLNMSALRQSVIRVNRRFQSKKIDI